MKSTKKGQKLAASYLRVVDLKVQGMATITPSDFSDDGCYRVFLARFLVIFRVLGVIAGHWRAQIFNSWVL